MFKVFVSHSSIDKELVDALRELLTAAFSDEVEIKYSTASVAAGGIAAGQSWLEWIHHQIRDSDLTIALLTPLSRSNPWLIWEAGAVSGLGLSRGTGIPVVPLMYGIRQEVGLPWFRGQVDRSHAMTLRLSIDDQPNQDKAPVHGAAKAGGRRALPQ